jgi:hypothetical protein
MKETSVEIWKPKPVGDCAVSSDDEKPSPFWQPIETAHKDGRDLFLRRGKSVWVGSFYSEETYEFGELKRKREGWTNPFPSFSLNTGKATEHGPTHWAEIPPLDE